MHRRTIAMAALAGLFVVAATVLASGAIQDTDSRALAEREEASASTDGTDRSVAEDTLPVSDLPPAPPVEDARSLRDGLLELASKSLTSGPTDVLAEWRAAYPDLDFSSFALKANSKSVSVYADLQDREQAASDENPMLVAVAVSDQRGRCAGGVLVGFRAPNRQQKVNLDDAWGCTALEAGQAAGLPIG
jgi:hypothetical protein